MLFLDLFLSHFSFYFSEYEPFIKPSIDFTQQANFYSNGRKIWLTRKNLCYQTIFL